MKKSTLIYRNLTNFLIGYSITFFLSVNLYAQQSPFNEFNQYFKSGQYLKAIQSLEKINSNKNAQVQKYYLTGLAYSKMQEYDKAVLNFKLAVKEKNTNADLYYEYGQALYASNDLRAARKYFSESAEKKFSVPASIYYVAHISQILEEFSTAKDSYTSLLDNQESDLKIKQIARFQLAETLLSIMRQKGDQKEKMEKSVEKDIIPMMLQAHAADHKTPVAFEINARIQELQKEFGLDPDLLMNGKRISPKRQSGYFLQKIKFDDNISLTNEENNVLQSKKESYILESEAYAKYDLVLKKRVIISPEIRFNFIQHTNQDAAEVYQNDSYAIYTNLKNKLEHTWNNLPASFLLDLEYSSTFKDWNKTHKREAYAKSFNYGIGESFNHFSFGDTSFKLKHKSFTGKNVAISNTTNTMSGDQTVSFANRHLLIALIEINLINNFNNTSTSTNTYLTRFDYLITEIIPKYTLSFALATTVTDTKEQKASRGTEITLNPSMDLSKEINQKMKISVNYDYTKSKSKMSDYAYQKSIFSTEFRYSF